MGTKSGTVLKVVPSDWETNKASIVKDWYIYYRVDNGKMVKIRNMNRIKDYPGRVKETKRLLKETEWSLKPTAQQQLLDLPDSNIGFIKGLNQAFKTIKGSKEYKKDVSSCIKYITKSAVKMQMDQIPIGMIRKKHIKLLLQDAVIGRNLSSTSWNHYRAYLSVLFTELEDLEIVDMNPVTAVKRMQVAKKFKETLNIEQRRKVVEFLKNNHPDFYRFINIFFHSGGRARELFRLQVKDINLKDAYYKVWVRKGRRPVETKRVIKNIALGFWQEQLQNAEPDWYVFSKNLRPGINQVNSVQTTRRWETHVKKKLGIQVDLYSLKHLNTDETSKLLDIQHAALHNSHASTSITKAHYAFGEEERMLERLKKVENPL